MSRITADQAITALDREAGGLADYDYEFARALVAGCNEAGVDAAIAYNHCANETNLFTDANWNGRKNPAGIGITGEPGKIGPKFPNATKAARFYIALLLLKIHRGDESKMGAFPAERFTAPTYYDGTKKYAQDPTFPKVRTLDDLRLRFGPNNRECVWMCDQNGPKAIIQKCARLFPDLPKAGGEPVKPPAVKTYTTVVPGLPGGPLVTDYPIRILLVPEWRKNNRPGVLARNPRRSVQHGNGNPNSTAAGEARYLFNGAEGRQASYHAAGDDIELWVMVPLNEVTWQAADGGGPGNMNGFSCEMVEDADIWASPARRARTIHICGDFMGRVAARLAVKVPEQHWTFNYGSAGCSFPCDRTDPSRHDCPNKLRHTNHNGALAWETYVREWNDARTKERNLMVFDDVSTAEVPTKPVYPTARTQVLKTGTVTYKGLPDLYAEGAPSARWRCSHGTSLRTYPNRDAPAATKTPAQRGRLYTFPRRVKIDGEYWLVSTSGSWALQSAFVQV